MTAIDSTTEPRGATGKAHADAARGWTSHAVFAGDAELLDSAILDVVAPAVVEAEPSAWFFERWADSAGPQLRVHARGRESDRLRDRLEELTTSFRGVPGLEPLLPRPASHTGDPRRRAVEPAELPLGRPGLTTLDELVEAAPLFQVSSKVAIDALREFARGRERLAYGLHLSALVAEVAVPSERRTRFWSDLVAGWVGEDARGRRILERLSRAGRRLVPDLLAAARDLRRREALSEATDRYREACRSAFAGPPDELVTRARLHTHGTCNRLGITPLEEALLGLLLAGGAGERLTRPAPRPERSPGAVDPEPGPEGSAIRLRAVVKEHAGARTIDGVSLEVAEGEIFGLLGPAGAGKTSLLGVAAGLRLPSQGSVETLGLDPLEDRSGLLGEVALAPADDELAERITVRENLELRAEASPGCAAPDDVLTEIGLAEKAAVQVDELERGERRRLALGCALLGDPRLLLADEPCVGLSPVERELVWELLGAQPAKGRTVVLTTRALQDVLAVCSRAAVIVSGSVVAEGGPEEIAESFPERVLRLDVEDEPDRALLEDLPDVAAVSIEREPGHWAIELTTRQPEAVVDLLRRDPGFPAVARIPGGEPESSFPDPVTR